MRTVQSGVSEYMWPSLRDSHLDWTQLGHDSLKHRYINRLGLQHKLAADIAYPS